MSNQEISLISLRVRVSKRVVSLTPAKTYSLIFFFLVVVASDGDRDDSRALQSYPTSSNTSRAAQSTSICVEVEEGEHIIPTIRTVPVAQEAGSVRASRGDVPRLC
jgi:hypothetical protein